MIKEEEVRTMSDGVSVLELEPTTYSEIFGTY